MRAPLALALNPLGVWLPKSVVNPTFLRQPQRAWGGREGLGLEKRTNTVERHNGDRHPKAGRALGQGSSDPSWVHAGCRATSPAGKGQGQLASAGPEPPNPLLPLPQGKDDQSLGRERTLHRLRTSSTLSPWGGRSKLSPREKRMPTTLNPQWKVYRSILLEW